MDVGGDGLARRLNRASDRGIAGRAGHDAVAVLLDHCGHAIDEVAEIVGEFCVVPLVDRVVRDASVAAKADVAQQVVAQRVNAVALDHGERIEHVTERLGHLRIPHRQVAVDHQSLRQWPVGAHQHRGPDHRVELEDVLRQQLPARRPITRCQILTRSRVGQRGGVVEQRVEPDVTGLIGRPREWHAPID